MDTPDAKVMRLRYAGRCSSCGTDLPKGTTAEWNAIAKAVKCLGCGGANDEPAPAVNVERPIPRSTQGHGPMPPQATGQAGGSAQRAYERRAAMRELIVRENHPRIGGFLLALFEEPQSTKAWAAGASGERTVGARLDAVDDAGVVVLHDRRIPGSRANIDHIVVCSLGVYVIDTKRYVDKRIESRGTGTLLRPGPLRLYVGGRDRTALVEGMVKQVAAVGTVLTDTATQVPVTPVLCFVEGTWGLRAKPFTIDGVVVTFPRALAAALD